jgi:hypothetical protein
MGESESSNKEQETPMTAREKGGGGGREGG